ncbi:hypothetical protein QJS10_CPA03g00385 [Acorus calamus]|uniref:Uncharacterized protein n=1 Tax=Acorus calamus TaxID=4465 RepID=A0AAV9F8I9_ACOCL|nr:hypothetical protein QJS10_CPA03g00385 [Acorus calamus]
MEGPSAEEVIARLKDDGDFDSLRLKIVANLKQNDDLRNMIIDEVKQSAAVNDEGAEKLKPRVLSDAIYQEIGSKVMGQISDALWQVIRSDGGMKAEIRDTVTSVYNKLIDSKAKKVEVIPADDKSKIANKKADSPPNASPEEEFISIDSEPDEPLGFTLRDQLINGSSHEERKDVRPIKKEIHGSSLDLSRGNDSEIPPGFGGFVVQEGPSHSGNDDDDPDVPPGFG